MKSSFSIYDLRFTIYELFAVSRALKGATPAHNRLVREAPESFGALSGAETAYWKACRQSTNNGRWASQALRKRPPGQANRVGSPGGGSPAGGGLGSGSLTGATGEGSASGGSGRGDGSGTTGTSGPIGGVSGSPGCGKGSVGCGGSVFGLRLINEYLNLKF